LHDQLREFPNARVGSCIKHFSVSCAGTPLLGQRISFQFVTYFRNTFGKVRSEFRSGRLEVVAVLVSLD
jgi:hypothetical protein